MGGVCSMYGIETRNAYKFWMGEFEWKVPLGGVGVYGKIILKLIFNK
jgi:hypothetical protein